MFTIQQQNEMSNLAFAIHRRRGPRHVDDYSPHIINPEHCNCLGEGKRIWIERFLRKGGHFWTLPSKPEPTSLLSSRRRFTL